MKTGETQIHGLQNSLGAAAAGLIVVLFCIILLWHNPLVFWNDDYELSVLPVFADMARSWSENHWPILSPYSWVCGNLAGEFQYGTFSLFVNAVVIENVRFGSQADMKARESHVRFTPESGHSSARSGDVPIERRSGSRAAGSAPRRY